MPEGMRRKRRRVGRVERLLAGKGAVPGCQVGLWDASGRLVVVLVPRYCIVASVFGCNVRSVDEGVVRETDLGGLVDVEHF